jgi:diaminohydroxyphosphoribosylaminopyrimidine deaminase/5-amino-6-(5-phosphoribosylamino)uracil reductase
MKSIKNNDVDFFNRAIDLAYKSSGLVSPRPSVGALVTNENIIVGEGATEKRPGLHAEVIAINNAGEKSLNGTLYCTLEPHSFHGVAPPCTETIIKSGISKVVCPIKDPHPKVNGIGFEQLKAANIEVITKVHSDVIESCKELISPYVHHLNTGYPLVTLKTAMSIDGKTATRLSDSKWITTLESRNKVHNLRYKADAVITGIGTIISDNSRLTSRDHDDKYLGRPKLRIVVDSNGIIPADRNIFKQPGQIVIASVSKINNLPPNVENMVLPDGNGKVSLQKLLFEMGQRGIQNILLECGSKLNAGFIENGLVDQIKIFIGGIIIGGSDSPGVISGTGIDLIKNAIPIKDLSVLQNGNDIEITGQINHPYKCCN